MSRESSKVKIEDTKYNVLFSSYHSSSSTVKSTIRHRKMGRIMRKLNAARFEARRTGDADLIRDAEVQALMAIVEVN